jgi:hypothetical protein
MYSNTLTLGSLVRPKVEKSVHYCEATQVFHSREYRDGTSMSGAVPTGSVYPKEVGLFTYYRMKMEIHSRLNSGILCIEIIR